MVIPREAFPVAVFLVAMAGVAVMVEAAETADKGQGK
jgi:hypothetical protein